MKDIKSWLMLLSYIYIYTYFVFNISNYKVYLVNKNCSIFVLSSVSYYCFFLIIILNCLVSFFFFVSHLSILQDLKYIAIYVRNINKKKNITRKQIQKNDIGEREYLILVKHLNFH
jgi:hypothetical protein